MYRLCHRINAYRCCNAPGESATQPAGVLAQCHHSKAATLRCDKIDLVAGLNAERRSHGQGQRNLAFAG